MLQLRFNLRLDFLVFTAGLILLLVACQKNASSDSAEETLYLADYEPPEHKWGYIDTTGNLAIEPQYDEVGAFSEGYAVVNKGGKWGYIDRLGKIVIKPQFRSAWAIHEDVGRVKPFNQPDQFITTRGKVISSDQWVAAGDFSEGLARVQTGSTYGYIDTSGKMVLPPIYVSGGNFNLGLAVVTIDEKTGLINYRGEEIIPPLFDQVKFLENEKIIICSASGVSKVFNIQGKELASMSDVKLIESDGRMISVRQEDKMYFYDIELHQRLPGTDWSAIVYLGEKRWAGRKEKGYFLLDEHGDILQRKPFNQINRFKDNRAAYYTGKHWGYMNLDGTELTVDVFGLAWDYKEGFARASFSDGLAYLDRNQRLAFYPPPGTLDMRDFSDGLAPVQISK